MQPVTLADPITCEKSDRIVNAISRVIDSIAWLFCRFVQGKVLVELMQRSVVKYACAEIEQNQGRQPQGKAASLSELSVKTGLDTRTLKKIQRQPLRASQENISAEAAILSFWAKDPILRDPETVQPRDIPIYGNSGTLEGLTLRFGGRGVTVRFMLNRLMEQGNVEVVNKHWARLVNPDWLFFKNNEDAFLDYAVEGVISITKAILHNLQKRERPQEKWVERKRYSCLIAKEQYPALEQEMNTYLIRCWQGAGRVLRQYEIADDQDMAEAIVTAGAGFYFWGEGLDESNHPCGQTPEPGEPSAVVGTFRRAT